MSDIEHFPTGAASQQRTCAPLNTWIIPISGLVFLLMLRPFFPEPVVFLDFEYRTSIITSILLCKHCLTFSLAIVCNRYTKFKKTY